MEYRRLGGSGLKVSALSFGSWVTFGTQLDTAAAEAMMRAAYDAGINFFDSTVILGASRVAQLQENLAALEGVPQLTDEVMAALDAAVKD